MKKILEEDLVLLQARIKSTEEQIFALGEDFNEAVNQSSETWHDNAPFDVVRDRQTLLNMELKNLRTIRSESQRVVVRTSKKVVIGSKVDLEGTSGLKLMIGGNWIGREKADGYILISCESPIAKLLLGKKVGDTICLPRGAGVVTIIS